MKPVLCKLFLLLTFIILTVNNHAQVITTNGNPVGMEHNLLFNATSRFTVTQSGQAQVDLNMLFDGNFSPSYSNNGASFSNPTVITLEGLPGYHTQRGAWVGWSTRYWPAYRFKIEGFDVYSINDWVTISDYSNSDYGGHDYSCFVPGGAYAKLRFTFYQGTGPDSRFGISELFFLHPEATRPYDGLFKSFSMINERNNNVGIGTIDPKNLLDVNGTIHAREVKVDLTGWSDFVFHPTYKLKSLIEVEKYIKTNGHLEDIPSAAEVEKNGINVGQMQAKLLQKVEELTLYVIELKKENELMKTGREKYLEYQQKKAEEQNKLIEKQQLLLWEMKKEIEIMKTSKP